VKLPLGFSSSAVAAGIKPSGNPDLALLVGDGPLAWAFAGTRNRLVAPCVTRNRLRYGTGQTVRAIAVNAGNANCAAGAQAAVDNEEFAARAAMLFGDVRPQEVLTASTGVIGVPLPMERLRAGLARLPEVLHADAAPMAEAILTTDTRTKQVAATVRGGARVVGVAKGSGMIHPDMATMLGFVTTDAAVSQSTLREVWPEIVARTFNQVTVDGDTSPNDMALVLASGRVEAPVHELVEALEAVAARLAEKIAADGEGAATLLRVSVTGARDEADARRAARAVAGSALVKAAVHGRDPNWGRVLSAVGRSGAIWDEARVEVTLQGTTVYRGEPLDVDAAALSAALDAETVEVRVDLAAGAADGRAWGCDLTEGYVRINADYTT
jgi:glutamate N-acetyltransferase/amino-acid N-acetyltransferase